MTRDLNSPDVQSTPGPWELGALRHDGGSRLVSWAGVSPPHIGEVYAPLDGAKWDANTRDANARLIAAAPSLLAALQMLHDVCVGMDLENERERPTEQKYQAAIALAEHALASATGVAA